MSTRCVIRIKEKQYGKVNKLDLYHHHDGYIEGVGFDLMRRFYDKDKKEKNFNVFVNAYREENKAEFIKKQYNDLALIFGTIISEIVQNAKEIKYCFNHDLIDNILSLIRLFVKLRFE